MKRFIFAVVLLFFALPAYSDIHEFKYFSLDIPEGWKIQENEPVIVIVADDNSGSLTITADDPRGSDIGALAVAFSLELGGTVPEKDEDGIYTFELNNGQSQAIIAGDEEFYMLIIGTGLDKNSEVLGQILESLEMK